MISDSTPLGDLLTINISIQTVTPWSRYHCNKHKNCIFFFWLHASNLKLSKRHTFYRNLLLLSSYMCRYNFTLTMQWYLPLTRHTKLDWDRHVDELPSHFCLLIRNRLFKLCLSVICSVNICLSFPKHYEDDLWCNPWIQIVFLFK